MSPIQLPSEQQLAYILQARGGLLKALIPWGNFSQYSKTIWQGITPVGSVVFWNFAKYEYYNIRNFVLGCK